MTGLVRAVVKAAAGPGALELVSRSPRPPGPGEITIQVLAAGICGTDLEICRWAPMFEERMRPPVVLGHEGCGIVLDLGPDGVEVESDGLRVGDLVAVESHLHCGRCHSCRTARAHVCEALRYVGIDFDGLMTDQATIPRRVAVPIPTSVPVRTAALLEPMGIAVRSVTVGGGVAGRDVLITGCGGPIGMMAATVARRLGAASVIAAETAPFRLSFLREHAALLGIDDVLDPSQAELIGPVSDATGGKGADVLIDLSGAESAIRDGIDATAAGGQARLLAGSSDDVRLKMLDLVMREISVHTVHGRLLYGTWYECLRLIPTMQAQLDLMVTDVVALEFFDEAFALAQSGSAVKVLMSPDPDLLTLRASGPQRPVRSHTTDRRPRR